VEAVLEPSGARTHAAEAPDAAQTQAVPGPADADAAHSSVAAAGVNPQHSLDSASWPASVLVSHVRMLQVFQMYLCYPSPYTSFCTGSGAGPGVVAGMQLDLAAIRYVSRCLDTLPPGTEPSSDMSLMLLSAMQGCKLEVLDSWGQAGADNAAGHAQGMGCIQTPQGAAVQAVVQSPVSVQYMLAMLATPCALWFLMPTPQRQKQQQQQQQRRQQPREVLRSTAGSQV
jgi:hypothetical protein